MAKLTKKQKATAAIVDSHKFYDVDEAVKLLKEAATAKFDETVELAFNLNINPKYADQQLRGATVLPHGTGKSKKVLVFAKDQKEEDAKAAGERPTAAFPSSHVGVSTICMLLLWHDRNYRLLAVLAPFYLLLCCATVYIQAHYLIDAIAGFITGCLLFVILLRLSHPMINKK